MSNLLLDEHPLLVMPRLATLIGLNESIVLHQVHYWLKTKENDQQDYIDGHYWVYNTYKQWQKTPKHLLTLPYWKSRSLNPAMLTRYKIAVLILTSSNTITADTKRLLEGNTQDYLPRQWILLWTLFQVALTTLMVLNMIQMLTMP